jgi:hypothetical protein
MRLCSNQSARQDKTLGLSRAYADGLTHVRDIQAEVMCDGDTGLGVM